MTEHMPASLWAFLMGCNAKMLCRSFLLGPQVDSNACTPGTFLTGNVSIGITKPGMLEQSIVICLAFMKVGVKCT